MMARFLNRFVRHPRRPVLLGAEWARQHAAHRPGMDVETVVEVVPRARLADGVAGLRPIGVIKGVRGC